MTNEIDNVIEKLELLNYDSFEIKISSETDFDLYILTKTSVREGKKFGYIIQYDGIPFAIDDNVPRHKCRLIAKQENCNDISMDFWAGEFLW